LPHRRSGCAPGSARTRFSFRTRPSSSPRCPLPVTRARCRESSPSSSCGRFADTVDGSAPWWDPAWQWLFSTPLSPRLFHAAPRCSHARAALRRSSSTCAARFPTAGRRARRPTFAHDVRAMRVGDPNAAALTPPDHKFGHRSTWTKQRWAAPGGRQAFGCGPWHGGRGESVTRPGCFPSLVAG